MRFFYDMYHVFRRDLKSYWRWKLHILFDTIVPIVDIALFLLVWSVIIGGGFEGVGMLNKDNYIAYLFSGFILWNFVNTPFTHDFVHSFIREKHWKTIEYIFISPLKKFSLPYGISILPLLRSIYSTIILLIIGFLFFGFSIKGDFLSIVLIVLMLIFSAVTVDIKLLIININTISTTHIFLILFIFFILTPLFYFIITFYIILTLCPIK